jgi:hypothetical protein
MVEVKRIIADDLSVVEWAASRGVSEKLFIWINHALKR